MTQNEFEHIAPELRQRALAAVRAMHRQADEQEDAAQETMLRLWQMHDELHPDKAYVLAGVIARHHVIDLCRSAHYSRTTLMDDMAQTDSSPGSDYALSPQRQMEYAELSEWLERRIAELPSSESAVLRMRQIEHRETSEIAALLNITPASVATLLSRARRHLLEQLKTHSRL